MVYRAPRKPKCSHYGISYNINGIPIPEPVIKKGGRSNNVRPPTPKKNETEQEKNKRQTIQVDAVQILNTLSQTSRILSF
tara:strand:- start:1203 stop:1442 length:240 start_codon:yes stop_codon:yes gene_type:complete